MMVWSNLAAIKLLVGDTFRQASASGISWMMLAVTAVCVLLCLSVGVSGDVALQDSEEPVLFLPAPADLPEAARSSLSKEAQAALKSDPELAKREGVETVRGRVTLAFGAVSFPVSRDRSDAVRFLETFLGGGIAGTFGLLLTLVWTAGFVPAFLKPSAASVLIAKPVSRWQLLIGKYCGVLTFVGFQVGLFVVLTWLGLGVRTRVWDATYLWAIPLLLLQFAIFYSVSVVLGVVTRSTVACVFGAVLVWLLSWGINYGSVMAHSLPKSQSFPSSTLVLSDVAYWISPKPIDTALILFNTLDADHHFEKPMVFRHLESRPSYSPAMSIFSSLVLTGLLLGLATHEFKATDY
jgi:ABC-type transport system involved in multi-copper enzyme maturation permease subunit